MSETLFVFHCDISRLNLSAPLNTTQETNGNKRSKKKTEHQKNISKNQVVIRSVGTLTGIRCCYSTRIPFRYISIECFCMSKCFTRRQRHKKKKRSVEAKHVLLLLLLEDLLLLIDVTKPIFHFDISALKLPNVLAKPLP